MSSLPVLPTLSSGFSERELLMRQSRLLVTGQLTHAELAHLARTHVSNVHKWANGTRHVPACRAAFISAAQGNWQFLQWLFEQTGMMLITRMVGVSMRPVHAVVELLKNFSKLLLLTEKITTETDVWSDEQMREAEEALERMVQVVRGLIEQQRILRAQRQQQGDGKG